MEVPEWKRNLPPGYRFVPNDQMLLKNYLLPKVKGEYIPPGIIQEASVYQCHPSELPDLDHEETYTYFFTKRDKRYKNGTRPNRSSKDQKGSWKITNKVTEIKDDEDDSILGRKNALVYMLGKNVKTNWIMHEYVLDDKYINKEQDDESSVVLCRIYERNAKKHDENSCGSPARDIQQNHKRASPSRFDDKGSNSGQAKKLKPIESSQNPSCIIKVAAQNQCPPNNSMHSNINVRLMDLASLSSPLDVQPISQLPATMTHTYGEEGINSDNELFDIDSLLIIDDTSAADPQDSYPSMKSIQ